MAFNVVKLNSISSAFSDCHPELVAGFGIAIYGIGFVPRSRNKCGMTSISAFTLIELSIVLVIIGLLVGGVLMGRDLIKSSEIRAQISQIEEFKTATNTFIAKYGYLPGDMPPSEASQLGFFTFTGANAGKTSGIKAYGNNDGVINFNSEKYAFWSHLSDAKLIKGSYGGTLVAATVPYNSTIGYPPGSLTESDFAKFMPRAKIKPSDAFVYFSGNFPQAPITFPFFYSNTNKSNFFEIGGYTADASTADMTYHDRIISSYQIYQIDSKIDDGFPTSGDVRDPNTSGWMSSGVVVEDPPCTTSGVRPIQYDLSPATAEAINCGIDFLF